MTSDGENNPPAGTANAQLGALLLDCAAAFETHGSTAGDELAEALRNAGVRGDCPPASTAAACEVLPQVLEPRIGDHAIVDRLRVINHLLAWRSSAAIRALGALEGQLAVVVLLGPQGMFHSERCMAGLFLQKPRLYYPEHWHEADELYLVLSGRAEWGLEGQVPGRRVPVSSCITEAGSGTACAPRVSRCSRCGAGRVTSA